MKFQVISDGACDLSKEVVKDLNIKVVPFYVSFEGEEPYKEGEKLSVHEFYEKMVNNPNVFPSTSLPSVKDYMEIFEKYVKENVPVLCICISSHLSGSFNSATVAKEEIEDKYEGAKIQVIDSMLNTGTEGLLVREAVKMRDDGLDLDKAKEILEDLKMTGRIHFTVGDVEYLKHGGRIGGLAGFAAGALGLRPIIDFHEGEVHAAGISRSRKKSMKQMCSYTKKYFEQIGETPDDYEFIIGYGYDKVEGEEYRNFFLDNANVKDAFLIQIGATTGVHTGPYPLGQGFIKDYRKFIK